MECWCWMTWGPNSLENVEHSTIHFSNTISQWIWEKSNHSPSICKDVSSQKYGWVDGQTGRQIDRDRMEKEAERKITQEREYWLWGIYWQEPSQKDMFWTQFARSTFYPWNIFPESLNLSSICMHIFCHPHGNLELCRSCVKDINYMPEMQRVCKHSSTVVQLYTTFKGKKNRDIEREGWCKCRESFMI